MADHRGRTVLGAAPRPSHRSRRLLLSEQQPQVGAARLRRVRAALVDRDSEDAVI